MSDSETAEVPATTAISQKLHNVVLAIHKSGKAEDLTVKRVRARAEAELGLPAGFFKASHDWKQKSDELIHEAVEKYCSDEPAPQPTPPTKTAKLKSAPKKRPAAPAKKPTKRRKVAPKEDSEVDPSEPESDAVKKPASRRKKVVAEDSEDETENISSAKANPKTKDDGSDQEQKNGTTIEKPEADVSPALDKPGDLSESELSSLIDESPKKKRQKKSVPGKAAKGSKAKAASTTTAKTSSKSKGSQNNDPDQAEVKRLQGWLVKCGIRKVWTKELANYDTGKEKIKHLKGMLKDAGMDGKYSNEKAAMIKEKREFEKDLEAIQEGEKAWGKVEKVDNGGRPGRRLARGAAQKVVSRSIPELDSEDGDEKDEVDSDDDDDDDVESSSGGGDSPDGDSEGTDSE